MDIRKFIYVTVFLCLLSVSITVVPTGIAAFPYKDYDPMMAAYMSLMNAHPQEMTYVVIGRTVQGHDMIMFKIGNPSGGRVLFDGALHGTEAIGSELLLSYAKWLLESGEPLAVEILRTTCTLLIPVVNADRENYDRVNADGVDLNRNFATDWTSGGSTDRSSDTYRGPSPLSEPESKALVDVFKTYKPSSYVNLHMWASPYYAGCRYANATYYSILVSEINSLSKTRGVTPFTYHGQFGGGGMAIGDAAKAGIMSFLIELSLQVISLSEVQTTLLKKFIPVAVILSQEASPHASSSPYDLNGDDTVNMKDVHIVAVAWLSTPGSPRWNPEADLNADNVVNMKDINIVLEHFAEHYS